jgi:ethanolamine utilization protein EutA
LKCLGEAGEAAGLMLTERLAASPKPEIVTFSGGVSEYLFGREKLEFRDLGPFLARALRHRLAHHGVAAQVWDPGQGLRATVVGASQFTVQVSGNTIHISNAKCLPISNLPVVSCRLMLDAESVDAAEVERTVKAAFQRHDLRAGKAPAAVAFRWSGTPSHARLHAVAQGVARAFGKPNVNMPFVLLVDGDVGRSLGRILSDEVAPGADVISIDGMQLRDFDFVDIGTRMEPAGVVPVIIKSLLFPAATG